MKVKLDKMRRSGAGAVKWTDIDESLQDVLGKDNPKLNAIPGGFSTPSTTAKETKVIVKESTSALAPSPMEDNAPRTADSNPRLTVSRKRKRAPAEHRTHFLCHLEKEHEWAREEHEKKMEVLNLQAEYYRRKLNKLNNDTHVELSFEEL